MLRISTVSKSFFTARYNAYARTARYGSNKSVRPSVCLSVYSSHSGIVSKPCPLPFGRICFVVLVMRKGGESSWSGPWHLRCTLEVFHVHSYTGPVHTTRLGRVFFCVFSLGLCFACLFVLFDLFVSPFFVFPWAVESSPLQFLALA